jgi:hypothetical protein
MVLLEYFDKPTAAAGYQCQLCLRNGVGVRARLFLRVSSTSKIAVCLDHAKAALDEAAKAAALDESDGSE